MKKPLPIITVISLLTLPSAHATDTAVQRCTELAPPKGVSFSSQPRLKAYKDLPQFCQVRGTIDGRTRFELRMPVGWNGRFMMAGCGGFCGALKPDVPGYSNSINAALKKGYAAISHDGGHRGISSDTRWAYHDPEALELYAHKVLPVVTKAGVSITTAFYDKPPHHRYYSGCSNGGRLGLMAAQRYPSLFDGIAAGGSIFSISEIAGKWGNWNILQTLDRGKPAISASKAPLLKRTVMEQCDGKDGQLDGIVSMPEHCQPRFDHLQCRLGSNTQNCFTQDEILRLGRLYSGRLTADGDKVTDTLLPGSEHYADRWILSGNDEMAWGPAAATGYRNLLSYSLFEREQATPVDVDTMVEWAAKSKLPKLVDADSTDLSSFKASGGKLFIYHGWADPLIVPKPIIDYYQRTASDNGGLNALSEYARLFMIPGWGHCWEKPAEAPDQFDPLEIVANWVENGTAPNYFIAAQHDSSGRKTRTRPICAYPKRAVLVDKEQANKASSYDCIAP